MRVVGGHYIGKLNVAVGVAIARPTAARKHYTYAAGDARWRLLAGDNRMLVTPHTLHAARTALTARAAYRLLSRLYGMRRRKPTAYKHGARERGGAASCGARRQAITRVKRTKMARGGVKRA